MMNLPFQSPDTEINMHRAVIKFHEDEILTHKKIIAELLRKNANKVKAEVKHLQKGVKKKKKEFQAADISATQEENVVSANEITRATTITTQKEIRPFVIKILEKNKDRFLTSVDVFNGLTEELSHLELDKKELGPAISSIFNGLNTSGKVEARETGVARMKEYKLK